MRGDILDAEATNLAHQINEARNKALDEAADIVDDMFRAVSGGINCYTRDTINMRILALKESS